MMVGGREIWFSQLAFRVHPYSFAQLLDSHRVFVRMQFRMHFTRVCYFIIVCFSACRFCYFFSARFDFSELHFLGECSLACPPFVVQTESFVCKPVPVDVSSRNGHNENRCDVNVDVCVFVSSHFKFFVIV